MVPARAAVLAALLLFHGEMLQSGLQKISPEVGMIWTAIKQAGADIWEELLNLVLFNLVVLAGTLLIIPWPFVTFGLFEMTYDIGQGKGIKFAMLFSRAAQVWKQAYIWGGINLGIVIVVLTNLNFYANFATWWAMMAQTLLILAATFWLALQLIMLPLYPRLEKPGFKIALRNAAVLMARYPLPALTILFIVSLMIGLTFVIRQCNLFAVLGIFSFIAVFCNRMVGAVVKKEIGTDSGGIEENDPGFNLDKDEE